MLSLLFIVPASCAGSDLFRFLIQLIYKGKYDIFYPSGYEVIKGVCYQTICVFSV